MLTLLVLENFQSVNNFEGKNLVVMKRIDNFAKQLISQREKLFMFFAAVHRQNC